MCSPDGRNYMPLFVEFQDCVHSLKSLALIFDCLISKALHCVRLTYSPSLKAMCLLVRWCWPYYLDLCVWRRHDCLFISYGAFSAWAS